MIYQQTFIRTSEGFREVSLFTEWIFIFICFEIGLILFYKFREVRMESTYIQELGYSILSFCYGGQWIFFLIADFYIPLSSRNIFLNIGYFFLIFGGFVFIYLIERDIRLTKIRYLFSIIYLIAVIFYFIIFFTFYSFTDTLSDLFWYLFLLFFVFYFKNMAKKYIATNQSKNLLVLAVLALITLFVGYYITSDFITIPYGFGFRVAGDILQLIAWIMLFYFFLSVPKFSEFEWERNVTSVFLMLKSGLHIFSAIVNKEEEIADENIISGALTAINSMFSMLTDLEGMTIIKNPREIIIIFPSKYLIGVVFCKADLTSLRTLLKEFVLKTEQIYEPLLYGWEGDKSVFGAIKDIYRDFFIKTH